MLVTTSFEIGGLERQVVLLANCLSSMGYKVTIVVMGQKEDGPLRQALSSEITVVVFGMRLKHRILGHARMLHLLLKHRVEILHLHAFSLAGGWAGRFLRLPVILRHEHGKNLYKTPEQLRREARANRYFDRRIAVSEDIRQIRIEREETRPDKIIVMQNGVLLEPVSAARVEQCRNELGLGRDELILGTVGRFVEAKAFDVMLGALDLLRNDGVAFRFLFVGGGKLLDEMKGLAASLGLNDSVLFAGYRNDVPALLRLMNIYVISSIREGLPVAMLEAMLCGLPVGATAVGGIPEVLTDGETGILVPPNSPEELARKLKSTVCGPVERRTEIGTNGKRLVQSRYHIDTVAGALSSLYREIYDKKGGRP